MSKPQVNTTDYINSLRKANICIYAIKERLQPVIDKVNENDFGLYSAQAHATIALSIGMLKYMCARMQGKDQGRNADDPLRVDLNNMKRVLAETKKKIAEKVKQANQKETEQTKNENSREEDKKAQSSSNKSSISNAKDSVETKEKRDKKRKSSDLKKRGQSNHSPKKLRGVGM